MSETLAKLMAMKKGIPSNKLLLVICVISFSSILSLPPLVLVCDFFSSTGGGGGSGHRDREENETTISVGCRLSTSET